MMISTPLLVGGTVGLIFSSLFPGSEAFLIAVGMLAGLLPDFDMFLEHRKTFHRPLETLVVLLISIPALAFSSSSVVVAWIVAHVSIFLHTVCDVLGQGKTKNPELNQDSRAIYNHLTGEWFEPLRIVDVASRKDLFLTLVTAAVLIYSGGFGIAVVSSVFAVFGLMQFGLNDWITETYLSDYDRFSEFIQLKLGFGPEVMKGE